MRIKFSNCTIISKNELCIPTIILMAVMLFLSLRCGKNNDIDIQTSTDRMTGIVLTHNTSMRIEPYIFSARVTQLSKGDTVDILDKSSEKSWIGRDHDYWYRVRLKDGMTGWIFATSLRILKSNDVRKINDAVSEYWEQEAEELTNELAGKWWSVNRFGDFTSHALELESSGKYRSYNKGNEKNAIEGEFNFDLSKSEVVFLGGTSFKTNLKYVKRGQSFILFENNGDDEIRFKKIVEGKKAEVKKDDNESKDK